MEISNLSNAEFKTLLIRMLKELSVYFTSILMIRSKMEETLIEIKNNLQGIDNEVNEAENQISELEHKKKTSNQNSKKYKRIPKIRG